MMTHSPNADADVRPALERARDLIASGEPAAARAELDRAIADAPGNPTPHLFHAIASWDCDDALAAEQSAAVVLRAQPANDLARSYRALALMALGRPDEGRAIFRAHGFNDNPDFRARLSEWVESQWLEHGRFFGTRALTIPAEPRAGLLGRLMATRRAEKLFFGHRYAELLAMLDGRIRRDRPVLEELYACALAAEMLRDHDRAWDYLSLLPGPEDLPDVVLGLRARCLLRLRRFDEAVADVNRVLTIGPEDFGSNHVMGVLCLAFGQRRRARGFFRTAHTQYMIDTLELHQWQLEQALLEPEDAASAPVAPVADEEEPHHGGGDGHQ